MLNKNPIFFSGLNGIRAIAAMAVVISHITCAFADFNLDPNILGQFNDGKAMGLQLAGFGVTIFFVLSGFLITYLLLAEKKIKPISIKKFYLRRILRIWPLYYLYLIIIVLVIAAFSMDLNTKSLSLYIFFAANVPLIFKTTIPLLLHYWSLGVEEQFYLFWPWIVKKTNRIIPVIIILITVLFGIKVVLHLITPGSLIEYTIQVTRFHCMLIGALGAILYEKNNTYLFLLFNNKLAQSIAWFAILLLAINKFHFASFIDHEIIAVVTLCIIIGQVKIKRRVVNLDIKPLDFLGKISYGIYVIHPLVIFLLSKFMYQLIIPAPYKYVLVYLSVITFTILLAKISFNSFEKYFMTLKKRFEVVKSTPIKVQETYQTTKNYSGVLTVAAS